MAARGGKPIVQDRDLGYERIMVELATFKKGSTKIGLQDDATYEDGVSIAEIAAFNEFGTERIPARPAHATTFDVNKGRMQQVIGRAYDQVLRGSYNARTAVGRIGAFYQSLLQETITAWSDPPNADSTQAKKGAKVAKGHMIDNPLIDTGQMVQSIRHVEEFTP